MRNDENVDDAPGVRSTTVGAAERAGIAAALGMGLAEGPAPADQPGYPGELREPLDTFADGYCAVQAVVESHAGSARGSWLGRTPGGRTSAATRSGLCELGAHELAVQDGNRWRLDQSAGE